VRQRRPTAWRARAFPALRIPGSGRFGFGLGDRLFGLDGGLVSGRGLRFHSRFLGLGVDGLFCRRLALPQTLNRLPNPLGQAVPDLDQPLVVGADQVRELDLVREYASPCLRAAFLEAWMVMLFSASIVKCFIVV
jgi:hypothetical protein